MKTAFRLQFMIVPAACLLILSGCAKTALDAEHKSYVGRWVAGDGTYLQFYFDGGADVKGSNFSVTGGASNFTGNTVSIGIGPVSKSFHIDQKPDQKDGKWTMVLDGVTYSRTNDTGASTLEDFSKAIELDPKNAKAYFSRGSAYDDLGQYQKAIEDYSKAISLDPKLVGAYNNRGITYFKLGQHQRAIDDFSKVIELDPKYAEAYNNRGGAYANLGQYQKVLDDSTKTIELDPKHALAYYNRAVAYFNLGQQQKAIEDCSKAIELDPKHATTYVIRGAAYGKLGQQDLAAQDLAKAKELGYKSK